MNTELVTISDEDVREAFLTGKSLDVVVEKVAYAVNNFNSDVSTKKGRDATRSFAAKIPKFKIRMDDVGKVVTEELKASTKTVKDNRGAMCDALDLLKITARAPLTEWERIETNKKEERQVWGWIVDGAWEDNEKFDRDIEAAKEEVRLAAIELENKHEFALLLNTTRDFKIEQEKKADEDAKKAAEDAEKKRIEDEAKNLELRELHHEIALLEDEKFDREAWEILVNEAYQVDEDFDIRAIEKAKAAAVVLELDHGLAITENERLDRVKAEALNSAEQANANEEKRIEGLKRSAMKALINLNCENEVLRSRYQTQLLAVDIVEAICKGEIPHILFVF